MRCRADIDFEWFTTGFELVGECDVVTEEAVTRHLDPHHACQDGCRVETDPHLEGR